MVVCPRPPSRGDADVCELVLVSYRDVVLFTQKLPRKVWHKSKKAGNAIYQNVTLFNMMLIISYLDQQGAMIEHVCCWAQRVHGELALQITNQTNSRISRWSISIFLVYFSFSQIREPLRVVVCHLKSIDVDIHAIHSKEGPSARRENEEELTICFSALRSPAGFIHLRHRASGK
jgi:hypothetical protein